MEGTTQKNYHHQRHGGKHKHERHSKRKGCGRKNNQNCKVSGVNEWGEPLNIEVPPVIADVLRSLMETKANNPKVKVIRSAPDKRNKGRRSCRKDAVKLQAKKERIKKLREKRAARRAQKKLKTEAQEDAADEKELKELSADLKAAPENKIVNERIQSAINNNEKLPDWLVDLLPTVKVSAEVEFGQEEHIGESKEAAKIEKRKRERTGDEREKRRSLKKESQDVALKKSEKRTKKMDSSGKERKEKRHSKTRAGRTKRSSVKANKETKFERVSAKYRKDCKNKGERISNHRGRVLNKKTEIELVPLDELENPAELVKNNNNLTMLLAKMDEGEKVELFQLLKKLMGN